MVVSKNGKMYYYISTYLRLRTTFFKQINNAAVEIPTPIPTKRRAFFLKEEHKPLEREKIRRRQKKEEKKSYRVHDISHWMGNILYISVWF